MDRDRFELTNNATFMWYINASIVNPVTSVCGSNNLSVLYPRRLSRSDRNFGPAQGWFDNADFRRLHEISDNN